MTLRAQGQLQSGRKLDWGQWAWALKLATDYVPLGKAHCLPEPQFPFSQRQGLYWIIGFCPVVPGFQRGLEPLNIKITGMIPQLYNENHLEGLTY